MALVTVPTTKEGNTYVSDAITATGTTLALQVVTDKGADIMLQRAVDGTNWVHAAYLAGRIASIKIYETTVTDLVPGQQVRVVISGGATPVTVKVLQ